MQNHRRPTTALHKVLANSLFCSALDRKHTRNSDVRNTRFSTPNYATPCLLLQNGDSLDEIHDNEKLLATAEIAVLVQSSQTFAIVESRFLAFQIWLSLSYLSLPVFSPTNVGH